MNFNPKIFPLFRNRTWSTALFLPSKKYISKKIKYFNHHFFNAEEERVLNPMISGVVPRTMKYGFCALNSVYLTILYRNWNFTPKTVGFFAGLCVAEKALMEVPNYMNETV